MGSELIERFFRSSLTKELQMVEIQKDETNLIHIVDVKDTLSTLIVISICISRPRNHSLR
jgi:uncharacterized membrane protein